MGSGSRPVSPQAFLNSAVDEGEVPAHTPVALIPGKHSDVHWIGGLVTPESVWALMK
jgi:hypothetical protein